MIQYCIEPFVEISSHGIHADSVYKVSVVHFLCIENLIAASDFCYMHCVGVEGQYSYLVVKRHVTCGVTPARRML